MKISGKNDFNQIINFFLDGKLSPNEEKEVLRQIADDDEARKLLRFDLNLSKNLRDNPASFNVPEGFTDQVMAEIEKIEQGNESGDARIFRLKRTMQSIFKPREISFRPATAVLAAAIALIAWTGLFELLVNNSTQQSDSFSSTQLISDSGSEEVWIRFVYIDDGASELAVAGNFSDWEPIEMDRRTMGDKTVWSGLVPAERGEHRYMFIRNGNEWISDPLAEIQRDDGFGNKNAVIYL